MSLARRTLRVLLPVLLAGIILLLIVGGTSTSQANLPSTIAFDPAVAAIIAQVTTPTLAYELAGLTGEQPVTVAGSPYTITTRYSYQTEAISLVTRYAYEQFAGVGLDVAYHDYVYNGNHWRNVVAEKPGVVDGNDMYLITAHIDDLPAGPRAPGADDNGSGSVAVLLAARLLAARHLAYSVRFVLFTGEEQGLRGSAAYAAECRARGDDIRGVVNLDMIAYNSDAQPIVDLWGRTGVTGSLELTRVFSDVIGIYGLNLLPERHIVANGFPIQHSDQWSFLEQGYPAILAIEDWDDHTPAYHKVTDTLSTLDLDYYADFTRAAVATVAHLGRVIPGVGSLAGTVRVSDTGQALSATVVIPVPVYGCTLTVPTDTGGVYSLSLPVDGYTLTVTSPGYYSAIITGVQVLTDVVTVQDVALAPWPRWYLPVVLRSDGASSGSRIVLAQQGAGETGRGQAGSPHTACTRSRPSRKPCRSFSKPAMLL